MDGDISEDEGFQTEYIQNHVTSTPEQAARLTTDKNDNVKHQREPSEPGDAQRPNKYNGPPSTWLYWNAADRDISRSINMMQARDLSLHLYNAHHLKTKAEQLARDKQASTKYGRPWLSSDWDAWPMPARDVPRTETGIQRGFLVQDDRGLTLDQPRKDLQEILLATITKAARQRFVDRDCEDDRRSQSTDSKRLLSAEPDVITSSSITDSDSESTSENEATSQETIQRARIIKKERSNSNISLASISSSISEHESLEPTVSLDDETAMEIAGPSIEHILSSLEQLLKALRTAQQHYSTIPEVVMGKDYRRSKRKTAKSKIASGESSSSEVDLVPEPLESVSKRRRESTNYAPRNWKDILGMAAILGWNSNALHRARDRCSVLFGESMAMPILDFDRRISPQRENLSHAKRSKELVDEEETFGGVHVDGFLRPIKRRKEWREEERSRMEAHHPGRQTADILRT